MIFEPMPSSFMAAKGHQDPDRQHHDGDERTADMQEESDARRAPPRWLSSVSVRLNVSIAL